MNTRGTQPRTIHLSTVTALNDHLDIATGLDPDGTPGIWVLNYDPDNTPTHNGCHTCTPATDLHELLARDKDPHE